MENELTTFLKNSTKALKNNTAAELNEAVVDFLKQKKAWDKKKEIDAVLEMCAEEYGINKRTILHSTARGDVKKARYTAYCLLNFVLNLPTRHIASKIFGKWQNSITVAILYFKRIDPRIKADKDFLDIYNRLEVRVKQLATPTQYQ
jgi:chromosomal replication initiation ATPase DnaA